MPTHKSAEKRMRQTKVKNERNRKARATLRTATKSALESTKKGDKVATTNLEKKAVSLIAKAVNKKLMKKKTGARKISRLTKALKKA